MKEFSSSLETTVNEVSEIKSFAESSLGEIEVPIVSKIADMRKNAAEWFGVDEATMSEFHPADHWDTMMDMVYGTETDGHNQLGLKEISMRKVNPENAYANERSHMGFAAEVISTAKENIQADMDGTGIKTYRADDLPDMFPHNDQYVDKVRINTATGEVVDRIQVKFIGRDGADCLKRLATDGDFEKYFDKSKAGDLKIEIPRDFYDDIRGKDLIGKEIKNLEEQISRCKELGKTEVVENKTALLEKYKKLDTMLERSNTSLEEARIGYKNPEGYVAKLVGSKILVGSHEVGKQVGLSAAGITAVVSTVDNAKKALKGEITAKEAFADVAKDTGKAGAIGYGTGFLSNAATEVLTSSGNELLQSAANIGVPGAIISVGVTSWGSIVDYKKGNITGKELAYDLGKNTTGVAGSMLGSAAAGAAVGSIVPGAGTAVGFGVGLVGGMVGYMATTAAYKTAIEHGGRGAGVLAKKAEMIAKETIESVRENAPDKVGEVRDAFKKFNRENEVSIKV